jgi:hypothetical protein
MIWNASVSSGVAGAGSVISASHAASEMPAAAASATTRHLRTLTVRAPGGG